MAKILLLGPEAGDAARLLPKLESHGYSVTECASSLNALSRFAKNAANFDVVLIDISRERQEDWKLLDTLCTLRIAAQKPPAIICTSRTYRPRLRMEVERRGARLVIYGR
jgi:CheY-like chemotaxis protein